MGVKEAINDYHRREGIKIGEQNAAPRIVKNSAAIVKMLYAGKTIAKIAEELQIEESLVLLVKEEFDL